MTMRDRQLGRLRLPAAAVEALARGDVDFQLVHDNSRDRVPKVQRDAHAVYGISWPWSCHPGIVLRCNIEYGGAVIRARTTELAEPLVARDGTELWFETNLAVHERSVANRLTVQEKQGAPSLTELVNRAFRRFGRRREDGGRTLRLAELATAVLGPHWQPGESSALAAALAQMRLEQDGIEYLWWPSVSGRTRAADRSLLTAYDEGRPTGRLAQIVHRHWVPMHLRLLATWMRGASSEKQHTYSEARLNYGMYGLLPEELPPGYTWVEPHARGGEPEEPEGTQLAAQAADLDGPFANG